MSRAWRAAARGASTLTVYVRLAGCPIRPRPRAPGSSEIPARGRRATAAPPSPRGGEAAAWSTPGTPRPRPPTPARRWPPCARSRRSSAMSRSGGGRHGVLDAVGRVAHVALGLVNAPGRGLLQRAGVVAHVLLGFVRALDDSVLRLA